MKKAMTEKTLLTVLIMIVVAFSLGYVGVKIVDSITSKGDTEGCRLSVLAASQANIAGETPVEMNCPRKNIVMFPEYYTIDGSKNKYASEDYAENVKRVFAEAMRECWYKMGEGKLVVLDDNAIIGFDKVCFSCSHFEFQDPPAPHISSLIEYIHKTMIPASVLTMEQQTYDDYIKSSDTAFIGIADNGVVNTEKSYDVLFLQKNTEAQPYQHITSYVVLGPHENINQGFCDYIYS